MSIVKEGWPFIIWESLIGVVSLWASSQAHTKTFSSIFCMLAGVCFILAGFSAYFFRDPPRIIPKGDRLFLSPADGKIMEIVEGTDPIASGPVQIMRIFLSVFDPHLQRSPVTGQVRKITYKKGKFLDARDPKAAFENEQNRIEIVQGDKTLVVTQIAGLIARRIVCWVKEGQTVQAGDRIGLIRFGSQVDVVFPQTARIKVKSGDVVTAGDTVLAEL